MVFQGLILFNTLKQDILNDDVLDIKGTKIPNFFKKDYELQFEFCHQFIELYQDVVLQPASYLSYENEYCYIKEGDVVFDCGANMGLFAAYAASKGATVHCFEPSAENRELLKLTQELYPDLITIHPYAVSNFTGTEKMCVCDNPAANHLARYAVNQDCIIVKNEEVEVISIDDFVNINNIIPTFIKIDVEGAEVDAVIGAQKTISNYAPNVSVAFYHTFGNENRLRSFMKDSFQEFKVQRKRENLLLYKNN